jgi:hypothetical protein
LTKLGKENEKVVVSFQNAEVRIKIYVQQYIVRWKNAKELMIAVCEVKLAVFEEEETPREPPGLLFI